MIKLIRFTPLLAIIVFTAHYAKAENTASPLPDPLTLEAALSYQNVLHPNIKIKESGLSQAKESLGLTESITDVDIRAIAEARYIEPPNTLVSLGREDHRAKITARKTLYDFGRTSHLSNSAKQLVDVAELELNKSIQLHRLEVMQSFFNVILADLRYNYDNEAMAIYFIQYDRAKERYELGQLSEIDVLQKQSEYMEVRRDRFRSEAKQRTTRVAMSEILNTPSQVISRFIPPVLDYSKYKIKDVDQLEAFALNNNIDLKILQKKREKARKIIQSLRANKRPIVSATAEAGIYSRGLGSNNDWLLGLGVEIPLYQGSRVSKSIAVQNEIVQQINYQILHEELQLKKEILSLWLDIDVLLKQRESTEVAVDYRELYLDRARSLYEMEVKTDLGDSMVALTSAARYQAETEFELAMKWERLSYLTQMKLEALRQ